MINFFPMFILILSTLLLLLYNTITVHSTILKETSFMSSNRQNTKINLNRSMLNELNISGFWFNKRVEYKNCAKSIYDIGRTSLYFDKNLKNCEKYSNHISVNKIDSIKPDYELLVKKIVCILHRINCPIDEKSFQIHDIPCQSNIPSGCPVSLESMGSRSQKRWLWESDKYGMSVSSPNSAQNYGTYNEVSSPKRFVRYPGYTDLMSRELSSSENQYGYHKRFNIQSRYFSNSNVIPSTYPWIYRRYRRQATIGPSPSGSMERYQVSGPLMPTGYMDRYTSGKTQLHFSPTHQHRNKLFLTEEDCLLLPPGGCDKWMDHPTNLQRLEPPNLREYLKLNSGCPIDLTETCNSMFPTSFSRSEWIRLNFTVSAVIRISGTLWWFGKNDRFQPLFRFHVLKTFDSDIHPYDEKMILTYSWPLQCICIDEIIVGKKYLMLTHSFKSRQTLHISKNTVFLSVLDATQENWPVGKELALIDLVEIAVDVIRHSRT
ncbi:unnamed protein product [Heterobilharzia americana]|nr:unnamed protein product [Heterobilharzia americana]